MGDGLYYDRKGKKITQQEWSKLFSNRKYQVLKQTKVGDLLVSTVWLGLNHAFGGGKPMIFETLVLHEDNHEDDGTRYSTEAEALEGHKHYVKKTLSRQSELDRFNYEIHKKEEENAPRPTRKRRR